MRLIIASNNSNKFKEINEILGSHPFTILRLQDFPGIQDPPETQETFVGNALQKAHFVHKHTGGTVIADDSGIEVDALDGKPGVYSKRYSLSQKDYDNNQKLLSEMLGKKNRKARFVCAMAIVSSKGERVYQASCEGTIGLKLKGNTGFGYDPLFIPDAFPDRTMAELSIEEKNSISHRGKAFAHLPKLMAELDLLD